MNDIIFSSWGGRIVDNRGKDPKAYESVDHVELPEYFKKDEKIKGLFGWGGIILRSLDVDILDGIREYLEANYEHSKTCDKCNYCKTGWKEQLEVLQDIFSGEAREEDLEFLGSSAEAIVDAGKCTIGRAGPTPVLHALKYFGDSFKQALSGKKPERTHKYYSKLTAPCVDACPIHLDVPRYVELIKDAKFDQSLNVIRERASPGRCPWPCMLSTLRAKLSAGKCGQVDCHSSSQEVCGRSWVADATATASKNYTLTQNRQGRDHRFWPCRYNLCLSPGPQGT